MYTAGTGGLFANRLSLTRHTIPSVALLAILTSFSPTLAQTARVQFIHASPYPEAETLDVYIDGVLRLDDFAYGSATPFIDLPAGTSLIIDVRRGNASKNSNPIHSSYWILNPYASLPASRSGGMYSQQVVRFYPEERVRTTRTRHAAAEAYLLILTGDPLSRKGQPRFGVYMRSGAQEVSHLPPFAETIFFAATPGQRKVTISIEGAGGEQTIIPTLGFGDFSPRYRVAPLVYDVDIVMEEDSLIHSFVQDYREKANRLVVNVVSGFDMRDSFTVLPDGTTDFNKSNSAFVQFIHNSPYPLADSVDVYVNDVRKVDDIAFREATPFIELLAGIREESAPSLKIEVTRGGDPDNSNPLCVREEKYLFGQTYLLVLAGDPQRRETEPPLGLFSYGYGGSPTSTSGFIDLVLFHGAPDIPAIAVDIVGTLELQLSGHLAFGAFEPDKPLPLVDVTLLVNNAEDHKLIASFDAPLVSMGLNDSTMAVLTSGFLKLEESQVSDKHDFGLVAALPSGGKLISFEATIPVPWWKSVWFVASALIGLIAIAIVGSQVRIHLLQARARELSALVLERTKDLQVEKSKTEEQAKRLIELDEAKNRFFANISHEFRTPISLILGPLRDLLDDFHGGLSRQAEGQIHMAIRSARRLQNLINQLLDLSRMDSGELEVRVHEVDLVAHLEALVRTFVPVAESKAVQLRFMHDMDELALGSDPDMLDKVFGNLLSNAIKFTPEGGKVWITINHSEAEETSNVEVLVKDSGPGISRENLARIFDRFASFDPESGDSTSWARAHEGIGIGLALAKELVELLEGVILVESEPGLGSTFTVRLPLWPVPAKAVSVAGGGEMPDETPAVLEEVDPVCEGGSVSESMPDSDERGRPMILIVDDNPDVRAYLQHHLGTEYRIVEAGDGQEGLDLARKEAPDLVLADVMMPLMDGYQLCLALKADEALSNVPVVMLTAKAGEQDTLEGLQSGADDYIPKPFSMPEVKARVANLIHARHQMRSRFSREIIVQPAGIAVEADEEVFLDRILNVINDHLGDSSFGVDWLADEVGMSPRHLRRRVEAVIGEAPAQLIRRLRLERASQLLKDHAGIVAEVAYGVGFKSPSRFSAAFRDAYGISPSEHIERQATDQHLDDVSDSDCSEDPAGEGP